MNTRYNRYIGLAALLLTVGGAAGATAQGAPRTGPRIGPSEAKDPIAPRSSPITAPCCHCIGDKTTNVTLYSGIAGWRLASAPALPPNSPLYVPTAVLSAWTASVPPAKWLQAYPGMAATHPAGHYIYEITIIVPDCTIPQSVRLRGYVAGDDVVTATLVGPGGGVLGQTTPTGGWGFTSARVFGLNAPLTSGATYTLRMDVTNYTDGPSGLLVNAWLEMACSDKLVKPRTRPEPVPGPRRRSS